MFPTQKSTVLGLYARGVASVPCLPRIPHHKKATADKSVPSYQGHVLMENRNGLAVAA